MMRQLPLALIVLAGTSFSTLRAQCPGSFAVTLYSTDFEQNDGGFVESGGGDWEYGLIPVVLTGLNCGTSFTSPGGAHSGTKGWGTILDDCYNNLGAFSGTGISLNLSDPSLLSAKLNFAQWFGVFVNFDYLRITANGTEIYRNDTTQNSGGWLERTVDLTPYIGQSSVNIVFDLWASTVVNRPGWYIDDVSITACASQPLGVATPIDQGFTVWPVPAAGQLNIRPSASMGTVIGWTLYDATGRKLASGTPSSMGAFQIDVEGAVGGMHILDLATSKGHFHQPVLFR